MEEGWRFLSFVYIKDKKSRYLSPDTLSPSKANIFVGPCIILKFNNKFFVPKWLFLSCSKTFAVAYKTIDGVCGSPSA